MRIETLELLTGDLDAQCAFYGRLGFPTLLDRDLRIAVGASELVFRHEKGFRGIYHFAFDVPYGRVGAAEELLRSKGVLPLADSSGNTRFRFESWGAEAVYLADAGANIGEFIGRQEIASEAGAGEFSSSEVLRISEIGIACADVPKAADLLGSKLGAPGYRETREDFFPLGDPEGLLILAQTGRTWYPDRSRPAEELPFTARIRTETGLWSVSAEPLRVEQLSIA